MKDKDVLEIPNEQFMTAEFHVTTNSPALPGAGAASSAAPSADVQVDGDIGVVVNGHSVCYELQLHFPFINTVPSEAPALTSG